MKFSFLLAGWVLGATLTALSQVVYLDHQHMDFRLQYHPAAVGSNQLDIILGYDAGTAHFTVTNDQVYIVGGAGAQLTIPSNPNYAFLGPAGSPIWILPQSQNITLPYLGTSAEDIPLGVFNGPLNFELTSVEGPGNFFAWANSGAGEPPIIKFICTNGVVSTQYNVMNPLTGSHEHYNWGFSTSGLYRVTFRVSGQRIGESTNIIGREVAWAFEVLPLRPWESWVSTNWPPATPTTIAGPGSDPDGDGILNAEEYAFGLNPTNSLRTNLPFCSIVSVNGSQYGALTFTRAKSASDIGFEAVGSDRIAGSEWLPLMNILETIDLGATERVTVRDDLPSGSGTSRFYQLRLRFH